MPEAWRAVHENLGLFCGGAFVGLAVIVGASLYAGSSYLRNLYKREGITQD